MDVGILTTALRAMTEAVAGGFGKLSPDIHTMQRLVMLLSYTLTILVWVWHGGAGGHGPFLKMLLAFTVVGEIIDVFPGISGQMMQDAANAGVGLAGGLRGIDLNDPGGTAAMGTTVAQPIFDQIKELCRFPDIFWNLPMIVPLGFAYALLLAAFGIIALQQFFMTIEWNLLRLAVYVALPFAALSATAFVAEKAIAYVAATGLKMLVLGMVIAMASMSMQWFKIQIPVTYDMAFGIEVLSIVIIICAIKLPRAASGLVNGGPIFDGMSAFGGLMTAVRLGMMAGGGGAAVGASAPMTMLRSAANSGSWGKGPSMASIPTTGSSGPATGGSGRQYPGAPPAAPTPSPAPSPPSRPQAPSSGLVRQWAGDAGYDPKAISHLPKDVQDEWLRMREQNYRRNLG